MKPVVNPQSIPQPSIRTQRLAQHGSQENRQRIIIPQPRNINRNFQPLIPPLPFPSSIDILSHLHILAFTLSLTRSSTLLNLRFHTDDRFRAIGETDSRAAVG